MFKLSHGEKLRAFKVKNVEESNENSINERLEVQLESMSKRGFSNEESRREKSLLIQKK